MRTWGHRLRLDQLLTDRAVSIFSSRLSWFSFAFCLAYHSRHCCRTRSGSRALCFCLESRDQSRTRSGSRSFCLSLPIALDTLVTGNIAFTDVTVDARDTCEVPFQPKLDRCFPADLLHRESAYLICSDSQRPICRRAQPANQALNTPIRRMSELTMGQGFLYGISRSKKYPKIT